MTTSSTLPYRFVWRNAKAPRWYTTTVHSTSAQAAVQAFQLHVETKLKKPLDAIVVDHPFYVGSNVEPTLEAPQLYMQEVSSLLDIANPFFYEFDNRVYAPGNRPSRATA